MDPNVVLPFLSTVLSFAFAVLVADQWLRRRQPYQLVWTLGLVWYGIGAGTELLGATFGWNETFYRLWYLFGAFGVAAYLGLGTVFLLNRTRFGYVVAFSVFAGGLFSILSALARAREGDPASSATIVTVVLLATAAAVALAVVTRIRRRLVAPTAALILGAASIVVAVLTFTAPVAAPGFHLDATGVPTGTALPPDLRILTPPFNIAGAFSLVFGAVYSAYIFMPKVRVLRVTGGPPVIGALGRAVAVVVNFVASLPAAWRALRAGRAELAGARNDAHRHRRIHPRVDERPQPVRSDLGLLPRRAPRRALHLHRVPRQHRGLQRCSAAVHPDRPAAAGARGRASLTSASDRP